ncbi:uncharacterized protein LOC120900415 [Anopheles arabiensis]|uniref:Protein TsetseEP domain-containing protein n=1 Tax=Anopheles arabiensis TaxID=7173 RepID=A0A182IB83_ANOAR|nr:uncharacterized protein LOC120900415 [Anopheles arabiensis]
MARLGVFLLLCCVLLQHTFAAPRPEFGSIGTVQSSQTIKSTVNSTTPQFAAIDDKNNLVLLTNYTLFGEVLPLMKEIGSNVTKLGTTMTNVTIDAIPKTDGNYTAVFSPIFNSIQAFITYIDTDVNRTRTTLYNRLGEDINVLFGDGFGNMRKALVMVDAAFRRLQGAITTAAVKNGRAQVDASITLDVMVAVSFLKATVSPVEYIVHSTIENIEFADTYLNDLELLTVQFNSDLVYYLSGFNTTLTDYGEVVVESTDYIKNGWNAVAAQLPNATTTITALPEYNQTATALAKFSSSFSQLSNMTAKIEEGIVQYVNISSTYLTEYTQALVPRSYSSINYLFEILIGGGANSRFCFFKFSPLLLNYYALIVTDVEVCFIIESSRMFVLADVAFEVGKIILFDVEDLIDNLTFCSKQSSPARCLAAIGPYYVALAEKTAAKLGFLLKYGAAEGRASIQRLGSCLTTNKLKNMQQLISATSDIADCHVNGPEIPI